MLYIYIDSSSANSGWQYFVAQDFKDQALVEYDSLMIEMLKIFLSCKYPSLMTFKRKLAGILMQEFNHSSYLKYYGN